MKKILSVFAVLIALASCHSEPVYTEFWSEASYATIEAVSGKYYMVSAEWSQQISLCFGGYSSSDMLSQMEQFGWSGVQSIIYPDSKEEVSVFNMSEVLTPNSPEGLTQINLYVPYPERFEGNDEHPLQSHDYCNVDVQPYQFHYKVDSRGVLTLYNVRDRKMNGDGGTLRNVNVRIDGLSIYFDADTSLYDWSASEWQEGHMSIKFNRY